MARRPGKVFLGRFVLQDAMLHAYFDPGYLYGGTCSFGWTKGGFITLVVGAHPDSPWSEVLATALHEVLEVSLRFSKAAYQPSFNLLARNDTGRFVFVADHNQFTEAVRHAADVMVYLEPELRKAWRRSRGRHV